MRIALYLTVLDEPFQIGIYNSVCKEAAKRGIDVICVQGETMIRQNGTFPSFDFFQVDGILLLSATIIEGLDFNNPDIFERFLKVPCVSIGARENNMASILLRNRVSMEHLMEHLINVHHYKNFLYIAGTERHRDNIIREHVFTSMINKYSLIYQGINSRKVNCNYLEIESFEAMKKLYHENPENPPDVIVCANDNMAIGALKAIRLINDPNWKKIAVTGFDDIPQAQIEVPALTSIRQPLEKIGQMAVQSLCAEIEGKHVPNVNLVDTELYIRNSCGCPWNNHLDLVKKSVSSNEINLTNPKDAQNTESNESEFKNFEEERLAEQLVLMQNRAVKVEQGLQMVSVLGQQLAVVDSIKQLVSKLCEYLTKIEVPTFFLMIFPEPVKVFSDRIQLVLWRENGIDHVFTNRPEMLSLKRFFEKNPFNDRKQGENPSALCINHLLSGNEQIGLIIYEADDAMQANICSATVFIANSVKRLKVLEDEKNRATLLEEQVALRTKELVQANKKLKREAKLRIGVEAEVLRISELEHLRFSLDLHDDICQRLAGISMYCKSLPVKPKDREIVGELSGLIDDTLLRTRQYAHDFFPLELDSLGLHEVLEGLCTNVQKQSGCECVYSWKLPENFILTDTQKINIFRIMQEAMQNVMKHSKATKTELSVELIDDNIVVKLKDNGIGMQSEKTESQNRLEGSGILANKEPKPEGGRKQLSSGLGLRSMKYRAHQIDAEYIFHSSPGNGTVVELHIPLKQKEESEYEK